MGRAREKRKVVVKRPSQHSQSLQRDARLRREEEKRVKRLKKKAPRDVEMDETNSIGGESAASISATKEEARLARKKANAHKVASYKKFNSSITSKHGPRAV